MPKPLPTEAPTTHEELLALLQTRFSAHMHRHPNLTFAPIAEKLLAHPDKLQSLMHMEATGGEPDVVGQVEASGAYLFFDCATETPVGRRSFCYDRKGLESRKANHPENTAVDMANAIGVTLLTEAQYQQLQALSPCDTKTSSWLKTPDAVRKLGGALFGDFRYGRVFVFHNGADAYYGGRGFRGCLQV